MKKQHFFGNYLEAIVYPLLLLSFMWTFYWAEQIFGHQMIQLGVHPRDFSAWYGVLFMPLLHAPDDLAHIVNNSFPTFVLLAAVIYYYREIALKVFLFSWLGTGISVWLFAVNDNSVHIGISGVDYALFGFLFLSGFLRRFLPLQAITLFVVFVYGSMLWGIFPQKDNISWEGHLSGLLIGFLLAIAYRKLGPQSPKYQYEVEKEMGIEPPDLEGIYNARVEAYEQQLREQEEERQRTTEIVYHIIPRKDDPPSEEKN